MKKLFVKIVTTINKMIDGFAIKRFIKLMPTQLIKSLYAKVAESDLDISTREISVKKGKIRYTLFIAKDKNLQTKFNLGRH